MLHECGAELLMFHPGKESTFKEKIEIIGRRDFRLFLPFL